MNDETIHTIPAVEEKEWRSECSPFADKFVAGLVRDAYCSRNGIEQRRAEIWEVRREGFFVRVSKSTGTVWLAPIEGKTIQVVGGRPVFR